MNGTVSTASEEFDRVVRGIAALPLYPPKHPRDWVYYERSEADAQECAQLLIAQNSGSLNKEGQTRLTELKVAISAREDLALKHNH